MADFSITATNVVAPLSSSGQPPKTAGVAGETITAGQALYRKSADSKLWKAQCDGTAEEASFVGIAINGATAGQTVTYVASGSLTMGSAFAAAGKTVVVSSTAGGIAPIADLTTGNYLSIVGYTTSASVLEVKPEVRGVTVP